MSKLKSYWNGKGVALQMFKCKFFKKRIPVRVELQVTKYCNIKCPYCYASNNSKVPERTTEEVFRLIDELYSRGVRWLCILGGEPLMRKDIGEIIDYGKKKKMYTEMAVNGWFIKGHIPALKKLDHLFISLDGDRETCDITRGPGTYDKCIEGMDLLKKNKIKFRIHAVLTKYSARPKSVQHIIELSERYGMPANFSAPGVKEDKMNMMSAEDEMVRDILLSESETINFYKNIQKLKAKGYNISSPDIGLEYIINWPVPNRDIIYEHDPDSIKRKVYPCYMKHRNCFVDVDGGFYACGRTWGKGLNIYKDGFEKCWEYIKNLDCYTCRNMGVIEQSLILSANTRAIINALRKYVQ